MRYGLRYILFICRAYANCMSLTYIHIHQSICVLYVLQILTHMHCKDHWWKAAGRGKAIWRGTFEETHAQHGWSRVADRWSSHAAILAYCVSSSTRYSKTHFFVRVMLSDIMRTKYCFCASCSQILLYETLWHHSQPYLNRNKYLLNTCVQSSRWLSSRKVPGRCIQVGK